MTAPNRRLWLLALLLVAFVPGAHAAHISSITVLNERVVSVPSGVTTLSDEHVTIWPPQARGNNTGQYLFFGASKTSYSTSSGTESGLVVLSSAGPNSKNAWTLSFTGDYGDYRSQPSSFLFCSLEPSSCYAQNFLSAMAHLHCPASADATFDLNYAAPAAVLFDPTIPFNKSNFLMVYEGTNRCIDVPGGSNFKKHAFSTIGIATSFDSGVTWPAYVNNWTALPSLNQTTGPQEAFGTFWPSVCDSATGPNCTHSKPAYDFGRYAVLTPPTTVAIAMNLHSPLTGNMGDSQPSAFIDNVHGEAFPYIYVVHNELPGPYNSLSPYPDRSSGMSVARAPLNGGTGPLSFTKWAGTFSPVVQCTGPLMNRICEDNAGLGGFGSGLEMPLIWPTNGLNSSQIHSACLDSSQFRQMGSISYVEDTKEYLLVFVCQSPTEPVDSSNGPKGAAWMFSTLDARIYTLADQDRWSTPQEIMNSWQSFPTNVTCSRYDGWYPSLMSDNVQLEPEHLLSTGGYVFFLEGCTNTTKGRLYKSKTFTITVN
jgi:hypothetical protein